MREGMLIRGELGWGNSARFPSMTIAKRLGGWLPLSNR